jgi:hypothetical protein
MGAKVRALAAEHNIELWERRRSDDRLHGWRVGLFTPGTPSCSASAASWQARPATVVVALNTDQFAASYKSRPSDRVLQRACGRPDGLPVRR